MKKVVFIFILIACVINLQAQEVMDKSEDLDKQLEQCLSENPGTTSERYCYHENRKAYDALLNEYYKELGGSKNAALKAAQLAWIKFRDAEFKQIESQFSAEGTMYLLIIAQCKHRILRSRVLQLERYVLAASADR